MIAVLIAAFAAGLLLAGVLLLTVLAARDPQRSSIARAERRQEQPAAGNVYIVLPPAQPVQPDHVQHTHTHYLVRDEPPAAPRPLPAPQPQRRALPAQPPAVWVEPQPRQFRVVGETEPWYDADDAGPVVVHGQIDDDDW